MKGIKERNYNNEVVCEKIRIKQKWERNYKVQQYLENRGEQHNDTKVKSIYS